MLNNDLYYVGSMSTLFGAAGKPVRITTTGVPNLIYNVIGEWLYSGQHKREITFDFIERTQCCCVASYIRARYRGASYTRASVYESDGERAFNRRAAAIRLERAF